jgi:hypothetical protein
MKSTTVIIIASVIVVTGRWARGKQVDTSVVVGGIVLALIIEIMSISAEPIADKFAWLILFAVLGTNAEDLLKAIGMITDKNSATAPKTTPPVSGGK